MRENKYNVNEVFELIYEALVVGQNKFILTIAYSQLYKNRQTLPREILQAISEKNYWWREYIKIRSTESWIRYKRATRLLRSNREALESSVIASAQSCPKRLWKYLRKNQTSQSPFSTSFTDPEKQTNIYDDNEKAEHFNKLFSSVFTRPHNETPIDPNFSTNFTIDFDDSDFEDQQVFEVLKHLDTNKSPDIHGFSIHMIRELATVLTEPLTHLYNLCLASGTCPLAWKKAIIKPLYKSGTKTQFKNYRPISNTSIFSRVMEKLIVKRIQNYFESNLLWHPSQHGFHKKRSCNTQLLEVITDFHRMADEGLRFDCIYIDFSKAFDKISIPLLLQKYEVYHLGGRMLNWIGDYL